MSPRRRTTSADPLPPARPALDPRAQRALGGGSRLRVVEALRVDGPLDAEGIAARVGLHVNTVRAHLDVLREAGLVAARPLPGTGPGRPRLAFEATSSLPAGGPPGADGLLAGILAAALLARPDGPERARAAGRAAGGRLVADATGRPGTAADRREQVIGLLDRWGFGPLADGTRTGDGAEVVALRSCPYRELAEAAAPIVCSAHRGVLEGAMEGLGGRSDAVTLLPMVSPGRCLVHLDENMSPVVGGSRGP